MGFGLRDADWVEPEEEPPMRCGECPRWRRCEVEGHEEVGLCEEVMEFTEEGDGCE